MKGGKEEGRGVYRYLTKPMSEDFSRKHCLQAKVSEKCCRVGEGGIGVNEPDGKPTIRTCG